MVEADLIRSLRDRDTSALDALQRHYGPLIRYIIAPILPDARDREECCSDVCMRVWEKIPEFDESKGKFIPWLTTLTRNAAIDRARTSPAQPEELTENIPAPHSDPEQELLRRERNALLNRALESLPADEKLLFYRKYYYRQSTAQIARELGTSVRAIEGRLYRIKKKLRNALGGEHHGR